MTRLMQVTGTMGIGEALRRVRGNVGQVELAGRINDFVIDQSRISKWERGIGAPSLDQIRAIEDALGERRGTILRLAGYVDDIIDARDLIVSDDKIDAADARLLAELYERSRLRPR